MSVNEQLSATLAHAYDEDPDPRGPYSMWRKRSDWNKESNHHAYIPEKSIGEDGELIIKQRVIAQAAIVNMSLESLVPSVESESPATYENPYSSLDIRSLMNEGRAARELGDVALLSTIEDEVQDRLIIHAEQSQWDAKRVDEALQYCIDVIYGKEQASESVIEYDTWPDSSSPSAEVHLERTNFERQSSEQFQPLVFGSEQKVGLLGISGRIARGAAGVIGRAGQNGLRHLARGAAKVGRAAWDRMFGGFADKERQPLAGKLKEAGKRLVAMAAIAGVLMVASDQESNDGSSQANSAASVGMETPVAAPIAEIPSDKLPIVITETPQQAAQPTETVETLDETPEASQGGAVANEANAGDNFDEVEDLAEASLPEAVVEDGHGFTNILLQYRPDLSKGEAYTLYQHLVDQFGPSDIFSGVEVYGMLDGDYGLLSTGTVEPASVEVYETIEGWGSES